MAVYGDSAANPPEVNYYTLAAGDHAVSAAAAATGHQALADALAAEIAVMGVNTTMTATVGWQGVGGTSMTLSAGQLMEIMGLAVAWLQEASVQAGEIVSAYHTAEQTMIPGPVSDSNRAEQAGLVATNVIGQNTPAIIALDTEYLSGHWPQNASIMATYQAVVSAALAALATPPPIAPLASNPAAPLASVAQAAAQAGVNGALQASAQSMTETANAASPAGEAAAAPATAAAEAMSTMGTPMAMLGQFSQVGQVAGQAPQLLGQAPQLLGQAVQLPMGLLGPLSGATGLGNATMAAESASGAALSQAPLTKAAATLGGGSGGGGVGSVGSGVVSTNFNRPASSFNMPSQPKLPGGWTAAPEPVATATQPSGMGTGGLYGAPMSAMGRDGATTSEKTPTRTMQIAARPAGDRGDG